MPPASPDPLLNFFVVLSEPLTPVVSVPLTTGDGSEGSNMTPDRLICFNHTATAHASGSASPTLRAGSGHSTLAFAACLTSREGKGPSSDATGGNIVHGADVATTGYQGDRVVGSGDQALTLPGGVRRLTPRECERLMSWPDDWTRWTHDGREIKDGPRYRLCGNGVVSNVAEWIGRRMMEFA